MIHENRTVLVTGSSRGIGKAIALELARAGFDIVIHARSNKEAAQQTTLEIEKLGRKTRALFFDVLNRGHTRQTLEADIEAHGPYYGVVCNAGIIRDNVFPLLTDEDWDQVVHTNLDGFYNVLKPIVMPMIRAKQGGRIVTISSISGLIGNRGQVNYSAAKAGVIGATKALSVELAKRNITVNCVAPGIIETEMTQDFSEDWIKEMIPLRRAGKPEEVASLVGYLFSDRAGYMTRQVISLNGGMF